MSDDEDDIVLKKTSKKSVRKLPDFDCYTDIPEAVRIEAKCICRELHFATHKGIKQKQQIFACFYIASERLGILQVPANLAKIVGLDSRQTPGAIGFVNAARIKGILPNVTITKPLRLVSQYLKENYSEKEDILYEKATKTWEKIERNEWIKDKSVILIAAYLLLQLNSNDRKTICSYFQLSDVDMKNIIE